MSETLKFRIVLASCSILLGVIIALPQMLHKNSDLYQGISVHLHSDEAVYLARVQEALSGRPQLAAEAFTGHETLVGTQVAFIEGWYGRLFSWTGWRAGQVLDFMDGVVPPLVFLSLVFFFRLSGFSRKVALGGAIAFCLIELYSLGRPIHMRASFFIMLWSLIGIVYAVRGRRWGIVVGGGLLGLLIGIYVWSFTFAWAFWGIFLLWELLERTERRHLLIATGFVGLIAGIPAIMHLFSISAHPLYEYGSFRSGMHSSRLPESWPYSIIFLTMMCSVLLTAVKDRERLRPYRPICVMILAAFVYMNQQVVHGITFNFVSHGILSLATAAVGMVLLFLVLRTRMIAIGAIAACVYLAAIGYDGRYILKQWNVAPGRFDNQHLATALPALDALPRARILSDPGVQSFLSSNTHHDIVYSVYLKNVLMTHQELASRFCLTQLPLPPEKRKIAEREHLVYPDAVSAFGGDTRAQEEALVFAACAELDLDPALAIRTFDVSHIFWNKQDVPDWELGRLGLELEEVGVGETWVLYEIVTRDELRETS